MLNFTDNLKVFVALEPCDLRKSFNGLLGLVSERLKEDPLQGALGVLKRLHRVLVLFKTKCTILPQSGFVKAIRYAIGTMGSRVGVCRRWSSGDRQQSLRTGDPAYGGWEEENWLFFGEAEAGERSAIVYTIIESCRRRGIDPYAYLRDVLTRLPSMTNWQIKELTPEAWAKAQRDGIAKAA